MEYFQSHETVAEVLSSKLEWELFFLSIQLSIQRYLNPESDRLEEDWRHILLLTIAFQSREIFAAMQGILKGTTQEVIGAAKIGMAGAGHLYCHCSGQ